MLTPRWRGSLDGSPSVCRPRASAERLFSIAGRTYDDLRQGMNEQMLEVLMWARIKIVRSASAARAPWRSVALRMSSHVEGASLTALKQYT